MSVTLSGTAAEPRTAQNLVAMFLAQARAKADAPFLSARIDGEWRATSWAEAARQVAALSGGIRRMGLRPGDRILLLSENRPEWCIADLAIMAAGCVTVPVYTTNQVEDHAHVLSDSGARGAIVSNAKLADKLIPAMLSAGQVEHVIPFEPCRNVQQASMVDCHRWENLIVPKDGDEAALEAAAATIQRDDMACIIYTSGTGGAPRGVMTSHGAILHNVHGAGEILLSDFPRTEDRFLSFLPLSHSYEHTGGQYLPIAMGAEIYYAESLEKLAANIEETQPTVMVVVPRLFEVLRMRIAKAIEKQGGVPKRLLDEAIGLGERQAKGKTNLLDPVRALVIDRLLKPKIRAKFGGRIKAMVSGGAPLSPEIGQFFHSLGLMLLQGYGQTESGPVVSCNRPAASVKMDTVGPPLADTEVKIAEDGEILVRGELVMLGYWRNEGETARAIVDGWLHTGDVGHIDEAGRIVITDRKKDIIVNDKGDNIAPQRIEGRLTLQPEIAQAMVHGDKRPHIVALIVPDADWAKEWIAANDRPADIDLTHDKAFLSAIGAAIDRVNKQLSVIEKVRRFTLADEPFGIENHEMTPSLKVRRHKVNARYADRLAGLYRG